MRMPNDKVQMIIEYLKEFCIVTDYVKLEENICRDVDDVKILGLSERTRPDFIITGDMDLLELKEFNSVPIITPRGFWEVSKEKR